MKKFFTMCRGCQPSSPPKNPRNTYKYGGVRKLTNKELRMLLNIKNVSNIKKRFAEQELRKRNKQNYGYELATLFGETPPPSNRPSVAHANIMGRILRQSGAKMSRIRLLFDPAHAAQFANRPTTVRVQNPVTKAYRAKRKNKSLNMLEHLYPAAYKNTTWRFYATPLAYRNRAIFYETQNSAPFIINKKSGARKPVPERLLQGGRSELYPRNMSRNTWNAYLKRANQYAKQVKSLRRSNNYATGRSKNKPSNSAMRYYFNTHPRALASEARTVENIREYIKNRIINNFQEHVSAPNSRNKKLQEKYLAVSNARNIENLLKRMNNYINAREHWTPMNTRMLENLYNRARTRNKIGFYHA